MNKNRIRGIRHRARWQLTTKPISIKGAGCKSGGCALKAVELTSGDLLRVVELTTETAARQSSAPQKSAEGIVITRVVKARTVPGVPGLKREQVSSATHER
jgi:hypothetical protein